MKTITRDVRERILKSYDQPGRTRAEVATWFGVSLGMVKKLLQQRRQIGEIGPLHHRTGRKPMITQAHRARFQALLQKQPDLTLAELRDATGLKCSLPAIFYVLSDLQLTYKKRRSVQANRIGLTLPQHARHGRPRVERGI